MSETPVIVVSFKDMPSDETVRESAEKACIALAAEFPETTRFEVTIAPDGVGHVANGHVTGRSTEIAAHAAAIEPGHAADKLVDMLHKQLRKVHDKHRFGQRRASMQEEQRKRG